MKLYIARHGETFWNSQGRWQGQKDTPLTPKGLRQAIETAAFFRNKKIDAFYCSPLGRARQTAQRISCVIGKGPEIAKELKEVNYGAFEGLTMEEVKSLFPKQHAKREKNKFVFSFSKGESYAKGKTRLLGFIKKLLKRHRGQTVLCVGHSGVTRNTIAWLSGLRGKHCMIADFPHDCIYEIDFSSKKPEVFYHRHGERKRGFLLRERAGEALRKSSRRARRSKAK